LRESLVAEDADGLSVLAQRCAGEEESDKGMIRKLIRRIGLRLEPLKERECLHFPKYPRAREFW